MGALAKDKLSLAPCIGGDNYLIRLVEYVFDYL